MVRGEGNTFIDAYGLHKDTEPNGTLLIKICYFALTTFSTVGYGDMGPISQVEQVVCCVIMLFGVGFFSFIMGNLIDILEEYSARMSSCDKTVELK